MKRSGRAFWILFLLLLAAGTGWWLLHKGGDPAGGGKPPIPISIASVKKQDMPMHVRDVGTVVPYESVAVRARVDSQVAAVKFKDGDYVEKGDLLFVLDDRTLRAGMEEQRAAIARDNAQLENLKRQYERSKELAAKGYIAQAALDEAKASYEAQKATSGASAAATRSAETLLQYTRITAPISGRAGTINVTQGNNVRAGDITPLVTINQMKPIRVQVALPQRYLVLLREAMGRGGVPVTAMPEGGTNAARGTLEYIDNAVNQETGTFVVRASFPNEDETLWPGMFVTVELTLGMEKGAVTVPEVAVQRGQEEAYVFVIENGKAVKRTVEVARMQEGIAVIASGLKEGEQIATDGLMTLSDGSAVAVSQ